MRLSDIRRAAQSAVLFTLMNAGCDESLPPRLPDPNALSVDVKIVSGLVVVQGGVVGGNGGLIEVSVTNVYTEVLQDTPAVDIRCRIWLADFPDSAGVATLGAATLTDQRLLQGGMLTILPRSSASFVTQWDYTSAGGTPFWDMIPMKTMTDMQGPYRISDPVQVMMSDTVRVFKPVPAYTIGPRAATIQFEVR